MIAMIVAVGVFFLMSGGGGFLGGGGGQAIPPGGGESLPESSGEAGEAENLPPIQDGGLLEQVESGTLDESGSDSGDGIEAMYDSLMVNDVHWTVIEADYLGDTLSDGTQAQSGEFVGVVYQIENMTDAPITLVNLELLDGNDTKHEYSLELSAALEDGCSTVPLEPEIPYTCTALFDVPLDATDLHVVLTDFNMLGGVTDTLDLELD